ncbi:MAG: lysylphosphatidylglycerol synthase domain-containing protein [Myxococcota bacterium]
MKIFSKHLQTAGSIAMAALGACAIGWLVEDAGTDEIRSIFTEAAPFILVALVLEGVRIVFEALGTQALLGDAKRRVAWSTIFRIQLVSYAVAMTLPAGRAAAEATKAAALQPHVGLGRGVAIGTFSQALNLMANATAAIPCVIAAYSLCGWSSTTWAVGTFSIMSMLLGLLVLAIVRSDRLAQWLSRSKKLAPKVANFRSASAEFGIFPTKAFLAFFMARCTEICVVTVLAAGVGLGLGLDTGLLVYGIQATATGAGEFVPGQIGVTEGAFRLAAPALGAPASTAVAVALLAHLVQLAWVGAGSMAHVASRLAGALRPSGEARTAAAPLPVAHS